MHPAEPVSVREWHATLRLEFARRDARTVLATRRHDGPLVVQKPLYPEGEGVCHAIVVHPPAGIAGGDALEIAVGAGPGSHALLTTPGATKWYRSAGPLASQRIALRADANAVLEWLPQETIVYRGALAHSTIDIDLAAGARYIGWEILCLGRTGAGERFTAGAFRMRTRLSVAGRLCWFEQARLAGDASHPANAPIMQSPVGLQGASVVGTLLATAPSAESAAEAAIRALTPARGQCGVTRVPGLVVARYRGDSSEAARHYFAALWRALRPAIAHRAAVEPRIWKT